MRASGGDRVGSADPARGTAGRWGSGAGIAEECGEDLWETCGTPRLLMRRHIRPIGQPFAVERNSLYTTEKLHRADPEPGGAT